MGELHLPRDIPSNLDWSGESCPCIQTLWIYRGGESSTFKAGWYLETSVSRLSCWSLKELNSSTDEFASITNSCQQLKRVLDLNKGHPNIGQGVFEHVKVLAKPGVEALNEAGQGINGQSGFD